jgi:hypothetical protein
MVLVVRYRIRRNSHSIVFKHNIFKRPSRPMERSRCIFDELFGRGLNAAAIPYTRTFCTAHHEHQYDCFDPNTGRSSHGLDVCSRRRPSFNNKGQRDRARIHCSMDRQVACSTPQYVRLQQSYLQRINLKLVFTAFDTNVN